MTNHEIRKLFTATALVAASVTVIYACTPPLSPDDVEVKLTSLDAVSSTALSGTAGAALSTLPQVVAKDQDGAPFPGVSVTFTASTGTQPTPATVVTNSSGIAAPTSWTMQTTSGAVTLTASASGLQRQFTVTVNPGPAASGSAANNSNNQTATAGTALPTLPQVKVVDQFGNAVPSVSVTFSVTGGGGTVVPTTAVQTDASGIAKPTSWTLGTSAGANTLRGTITGVATPVTFTATGVSGTAASIAINPNTSSQGQSAVAGTNVAVAPSVLVRDANGNPVANLGVRFTVASGNGKLLANASDATGSATFDATTDASGLATAFAWKLGSVGTNTLSVSIPTVSAVTPFTITATGTVGPPSTIAVVTETPSSNNQSAFVSTDVAVAPGAIVKDAQGNPVPNVSVTFNVVGGGGTIKTTAAGSQVTTGTVNTDANGIARIYSWTLGSGAGTNTLNASVTGNSSINKDFFATGRIRQIVASIALNGGDNQTAQVMTAVATAPSVKVLDINGQPVVGATVVFSSTGGGGQATSGTATTDASGIAKPASWVLGRSAGTQTLTATLQYDNASSSDQFTGSTAGTLTNAQIAGNPVVFNATATPGPAAKIVGYASDYLRNRIGFSAGAQVTDLYGNYVTQSGVQVTVSITGSGATLLGNAVFPTDGGGYAYFPLMYVQGTAGTRTMTWSASGLTSYSQSFDLVGGMPTKIAINGGDAQSALQLTTLTTSPTVKVTDQDNNIVPGATVRFAVTGGGGQITDALTYTDGSGIAGTTWTLGVAPGTNTLSATVINPYEYADAYDPASTVIFSGATAGTLTTQTVAPIVFSATATDRTTCNAASLTVGSTVGGTFNKSTSCLRSVSGTYLPTDLYAITTSASQTNFSLTMTSAAVAPRIASFIWPPNGGSFYLEGASPLSTYYFVKAGTYTIYATTSGTNTGSYTLSSTSSPSLPSGCLYGMVTTGISVTHTLDTFCSYTLNNGNIGSSKRYILYVPSGASVTVTASSSAFDPYLEMYQISGTSRSFVAGDDNSGGGTTARIANPLTGRLYEIRVTNAGNFQAGGTFTLTIQ